MSQRRCGCIFKNGVCVEICAYHNDQYVKAYKKGLARALKLVGNSNFRNDIIREINETRPSDYEDIKNNYL